MAPQKNTSYNIATSQIKINQQLIFNYHTHNLYAIFAKFIGFCKQIASNLISRLNNTLLFDAVP